MNSGKISLLFVYNENKFDLKFMLKNR